MIYDLAFALIPPLGTDYHRCRHSLLLENEWNIIAPRCGYRGKRPRVNMANITGHDLDNLSSVE
jgi:hypothetical protein